MGGTFSSFSGITAAIRQEMYAAMEETINNSFQDTHENVDGFYNSPEGSYARTGQLAESPEQEINGGGDSVTGEIRLDTSYKYNPSGRDTETIYGYAEDGGLLGNGGFWSKTVKEVEKNKDNAFSKRFK